MGHTAISWTDATLNFATGCTKVSDGCLHCYMFREYPRLKSRGVRGYEAFPDHVQLFPERLEQVRDTGAPKMYFVNSMSDSFHRDVPDELILDMLRRFRDAPRHTAQVLTKRPGRAVRFWKRVGHRALGSWPPNVWLGVSTENQVMANNRIPLLLRLPAPIRFLSCEPLLGPIDLGRCFPCGYYCDPGPDGTGHHDHPFLSQVPSPIQWIITGGESGPSARPTDQAWIYDLYDQVRLTGSGVAFHHKQWGEWVPEGELDSRPPDSIESWIGSQSRARHYRVGRRNDPATIFGRVNQEWPETADPQLTLT